MRTLESSVTRTRETAYVPVVDGFRGLAVLWIILGHVRWRLQAAPPTDVDPLSYIFTASYFGVDLLFVVSGFVLFLPAVVNNGSLGRTKTYAIRRAARIVPAFYAAMVLSYIVALKLNGGARGGAGAWLSHALFLSAHAHPREDIGFGVNSPIWTMSVEVIFYALLPLVATWYHRHPFAGLGVAIGLTEGWHALTNRLPDVIQGMNIHWTTSSITDAQDRMAHAFPGFMTQFAVGMTAAWIYSRVRSQPETDETRRLFPAVALVSFLGILAIAGVRGWEVAHGHEGLFDHWTRTLDRSLLFGALVCATALSPRWVGWPVGNDASRFTGTVCYGAYLSHLPLIYLLIPALGLDPGDAGTTDLFVLAAAVVPLAFAVGVVSYTFLEQPVRQLVRRRKDVRRQPARTLRPVALAGARG
ncbi:MAG TPA: acyltransferase [Actinomycetota bacterium]|jgi:peptidoglycan/LPS O-acetylase OafA/YrhL|nr:acyltransferase [Actinomycetota bacterium]